MADTSVTKVEAAAASRGSQGQRLLASGRGVSMRLWENEEPGTPSTPVRRGYETVGYVLSGRAELTLEGQVVRLEPGSSWIVPKDAEHSYRFLESFTAVEATHPPAEMYDRDAVPSK